MYPYSSETASTSAEAPAEVAAPEPADGEPTLTDLHGVFPAQRPPVDATVLEEPTSEVPVIRPSGGEPDAAPDGPDGPDGPDEPDAITADDLDLDPDDPAPFLADAADAAAESVAVPRTTEMSKMTWTPAPQPAQPPEPEPATPLAEAEPTFPPEPTFVPEPTFAPEPALPEAALPAPPGLVPPIEPAYAEPPVIAEPEPAVSAEPAASPQPAPEPVSAGRPGDVAERPIALWSAEAADRLREEWRDLQGQFIDDPEAAVAGAKQLVTDAVHELAETLLAAQDALDPYRDNGRVDTEMMRVAMRRYREFLERVLAL